MGQPHSAAKWGFVLAVFLLFVGGIGAYRWVIGRALGDRPLADDEVAWRVAGLLAGVDMDPPPSIIAVEAVQVGGRDPSRFYLFRTVPHAVARIKRAAVDRARATSNGVAVDDRDGVSRIPTGARRPAWWTPARHGGADVLRVATSGSCSRNRKG